MSVQLILSLNIQSLEFSKSERNPLFKWSFYTKRAALSVKLFDYPIKNKNLLWTQIVFEFSYFVPPIILTHSISPLVGSILKVRFNLNFHNFMLFQLKKYFIHFNNL